MKIELPGQLLATSELLSWMSSFYKYITFLQPTVTLKELKTAHNAYAPILLCHGTGEGWQTTEVFA